MADGRRRRFIVPPHLLEQVMRYGDPQDRESAATIRGVEELFGTGSPEAGAVSGAWSQVGVI